MSHKPRLRKPLDKKECKNCGEEFDPYRKIQEFCSPTCRGQYYWKTHEVVPIGLTPEPEPTPETVTN